MHPTSLACFLVDKDAAGNVQRGVAERPIADLPPGDVLVRVEYSSLNYKDALAAGAHPGVVRKLPHVPGIDAAGVVVESSSPQFQQDQEVIITGYELGAGQWGGWAEYVRVPAGWVVPLPAGLTLKEAMILGTAGFTAAQSVAAIQTNGVGPEGGDVVVTGATGGVGCLAVKLLAKLGYSVVAVTGKPQLHSRLSEWGAARVIGREEVVKDASKPLLAGRWAAAVDTVGGQTLATIIRETKNYGVVAACGLVGGTELPLTVHPFILRGVMLAGIGSAALPYDRRLEIWRRLSDLWRLEGLESLATTIELPQLEAFIQRMLAGQIVGRTVVGLAA
ncbi:MAG: YhdH/YhfP family quinone oxidoreductase [Planctomycetaceae bacterium]|nr:YhdH/YhfP family quinone oxidoreductase [Planctomycetaceae bacterium]